MRPPLALSDVSTNPSFLRTTPAKNPRTECCCQPVAFMMPVIVAPLGCLRRVSTACCLVPFRLEGEREFPSFAGRFALLARAGALFDVLLCDILDPFGCDGARH